VLKELALEEEQVGGWGKRRGMRHGGSRVVCVEVYVSHCGRGCYYQGLPRDTKDGVTCKIGIIDYSVDGAC
jgi:hypothetical protein